MKTAEVALFLSLASFFFAVQELAIAATITLTNKCSYTVWPATLATGHQMPQLSTTGFELPTGASKSMSIPSPWLGRIWARTGCSNDSGIFVCVTGDCGSGQVECNGAGASPPATIAEVTTAASISGEELYHVSYVDGFNLPMSMAPKNGSRNCKSSSCPENITPVCPEELQVRWSDGKVIACKSACLAFNSPMYCCAGDIHTTDRCRTTRYSQFFERQCPDADSYAYDNTSLGSNFSCPKGSSYTITFCPYNQRGSIISADVFNEMLKHRNDDACEGKGFYTYEAFTNAAASFGGFGTTGDDTTRKRELAAFFGQTSHETTGGWPTAPDGPYAWGYCYIEERSQDQYRGRGPFQLTYDFNYKEAGDAIQVDLLSNPALAATDAVISFKTAIWFWMTSRGNMPSSHDVITNKWTPSYSDKSAGRMPGYGVITNIINGVLECNHSNDSRVKERIGFYKRYCDIMGIGYGDNLDCDRQAPFGSA